MIELSHIFVFMALCLKVEYDYRAESIQECACYRFAVTLSRNNYLNRRDLAAHDNIRGRRVNLADKLAPSEKGK